MRVHEYGDASVIRQDEIPRPRPTTSEVLIQVAATSFNPSEIALRSGLLRSIIPLDLPFTLGWDVSGTIVEVGPAVSTFAIGDKVIGRLEGGAAAEYVSAPADALIQAPETIALTQAAAIPVAGLTAWQAVFEHARIAPGQRVFINGAGGGVGGFAVQLAKYAGARVVATASPRSADAVRGQGADLVVDYTSGIDPGPDGPAGYIGGPVDAVLNLAAISPQQAMVLGTLVRPGGLLVSITVPIAAPPGVPVEVVRFVARNDPGQLASLVKLVEAGAVRVDVSASRSLSDIAEVHRDAESNLTRGKIILTPDIEHT